MVATSKRRRGFSVTGSRDISSHGFLSLFLHWQIRKIVLLIIQIESPTQNSDHHNDALSPLLARRTAAETEYTTMQATKNQSSAQSTLNCA
jgi:tRNA U38,U39,U40 pseudouridine synthase TruA